MSEVALGQSGNRIRPVAVRTRLIEDGASFGNGGRLGVGRLRRLAPGGERRADDATARRMTKEQPRAEERGNDRRY
jgi:hypothetical protein